MYVVGDGNDDWWGLDERGEFGPGGPLHPSPAHCAVRAVPHRRYFIFYHMRYLIINSRWLSAVREDEGVCSPSRRPIVAAERQHLNPVV